MRPYKQIAMHAISMSLLRHGEMQLSFQTIGSQRGWGQKKIAILGEVGFNASITTWRRFFDEFAMIGDFESVLLQITAGAVYLSAGSGRPG